MSIDIYRTTQSNVCGRTRMAKKERIFASVSWVLFERAHIHSHTQTRCSFMVHTLALSIINKTKQKHACFCHNALLALFAHPLRAINTVDLTHTYHTYWLCVDIQRKHSEHTHIICWNFLQAPVWLFYAHKHVRTHSMLCRAKNRANKSLSCRWQLYAAHV